MEQAKRCVSCGKGLLETGSTTFICPSCNKIIGRCGSCREQSVTYTCPSCNLTGP